MWTCSNRIQRALEVQCGQALIPLYAMNINLQTLQGVREHKIKSRVQLFAMNFMHTCYEGQHPFEFAVGRVLATYEACIENT